MGCASSAQLQAIQQQLERLERDNADLRAQQRQQSHAQPEQHAAAARPRARSDQVEHVEHPFLVPSERQPEQGHAHELEAVRARNEALERQVETLIAALRPRDGGGEVEQLRAERDAAVARAELAESRLADVSHALQRLKELKQRQEQHKQPDKARTRSTSAKTPLSRSRSAEPRRHSSTRRVRQQDNPLRDSLEDVHGFGDDVYRQRNALLAYVKANAPGAEGPS